MPHIAKNALVPFSAEKMYALVNDVACYPEFVKGCETTKILTHTADLMVAKLVVSQSGFSKSFTTRNTLQKNRQIQMELEDGPFEYLTGVWRFHSLDDNACKIEFELDFKFKNQLLGMAFGSAFQQIVESMMQSFINRAKQLAQSESIG